MGAVLRWWFRSCLLVCFCCWGHHVRRVIVLACRRQCFWFEHFRGVGVGGRRSYWSFGVQIGFDSINDVTCSSCHLDPTTPRSCWFLPVHHQQFVHLCFFCMAWMFQQADPRIFNSFFTALAPWSAIPPVFVLNPTFFKPPFAFAFYCNHYNWFLVDECDARQLRLEARLRAEICLLYFLCFQNNQCVSRASGYLHVAFWLSSCGCSFHISAHVSYYSKYYY